MMKNLKALLKEMFAEYDKACLEAMKDRNFFWMVNPRFGHCC